MFFEWVNSCVTVGYPDELGVGVRAVLE